MAKEKRPPISPINGQPLPRGRPFTSETARAARQKRTKKEQEQHSITEAFRRRRNEVFTDARTGRKMTGAEIIADSIIKGANAGNANMVKLALDLMGETPKLTVSVESGQLAELIDGLKEPIQDDIYTETTGADGAVED